MPDSLETNTTVSHYRILRKLGVGGMGEVYFAEDVKLGRKVALKVLPPDIALGQGRMHRFVQEAKAASSLNHPNIAHIYEIGESNGINFIAMEFVEGATLREKIHDEKVDLITVLKYLVQVADGLAKAHSAGIVHRDLKPDNIMISRDGYAKILDFGLAKLIEPPEHTTANGQGPSEAATAILSQYSTPGMILGTPGYMSPEQARGQTDQIDHRSDIFSLTARGWLFIGTVEWLSDGSGIVFTAREQVLGALQLWQASYPQGEVRRITNDLNAYDAYSLSLTADAHGIVSVQGDPVSNIWVAPDGDASHARAITARKNVQEGHYGVAWTPDGKLLYDSDASGKSSIWVVNADGSDPKPLTDGAADDYAPEASPDGRTMIFGSRRTNLYEVWRMDSDGSNPKQLTQEAGVPTFSLSSDGQWVFYNPFIGGIRKVSVDGGPQLELVPKGDQRNPQVSPDGTRLAYFSIDEQTKRPKLAVINSEGGPPINTFALPVTSGGIYEGGFSLLYRGFHWSPDGHSLVYVNTLSGVSNLWRQSLDGSRPLQITDFKSDLIYNFAYARDGRTLAFARGAHARDAVLISDLN